MRYANFIRLRRLANIKSKRVIVFFIAVLFCAFCSMERPNTDIDDRSLDNVPTFYIPNSFPFVRSIPIPLDEKMDLHLKEFRANANQLQQKYPDSFIIMLPTTEKVVALTFDDGPDKSTLAIINILNNYKIHGTFFFVGQLINEHSKTVLAAIDGGHIVANHSWTHSRPANFDTSHLMKEILKAQKSIGNFYDAPKLFRPPYGLVNDEQMHEITDAGFRVVAWSVDSMDWYLSNPKDIETCVVTQIHPGAIILMHSRQATINALPHIIETIQKLGYSFVTVDAGLK